MSENKANFELAQLRIVGMKIFTDEPLTEDELTAIEVIKVKYLCEFD